MKADEAKSAAADAIHANAETLIELSHAIHGRPELAMHEAYASELVGSALESFGFDVERGAFDIETCVSAVAGRAGPEFAICAEYDALPDIGHACGHNVIAAAAVGAGAGLAYVADDLGLRVNVLGTPAEEAIGAKALLVGRGAFNDITAALMVHPAAVDMLATPVLALRRLVITVRGRSSHASVTHTRSGNALDCLVDVYRALRERPLGPYERCNGFISDGGTTPNVVTEQAAAEFFVRAKTLDDLDRLIGVLRSEIETCVAAYGCTVELDTPGATYRELKHNSTLEAIYRDQAETLGREFMPEMLIGPETAASTDMGNVSQVVPVIHPMIGIESGAYANHQRGFTAAAISKPADEAIIDGATALAWTIIELASDPELVEGIQADFETSDSLGAPKG